MTRSAPPALILICLLIPIARADFTNNIMLTGYWPQTNNMLRAFSTNPDQNPDGWIGENWEEIAATISTPTSLSFPTDSARVWVTSRSIIRTLPRISGGSSRN